MIFGDVTELSKWYQATYVPEKKIKLSRSSRGIFKRVFFFFFVDVTELNKCYQAAYVPKMGSSQHVIQGGGVFFFGALTFA